MKGSTAMTTPANRFVVGPDPQGRSAVLQRGLIDTSAAHRVDLGHRDGRRAGMTKCRGGHHCAEPDRRRLAGQPG
jgi:hypothetical protein